MRQAIAKTRFVFMRETPEQSQIKQTNNKDKKEI
jgi:hypothetical protein